MLVGRGVVKLGAKTQSLRVNRDQNDEQKKGKNK